MKKAWDKLRIERCANGWVVVLNSGADKFVGRHVFETNEKLIGFLVDQIQNHNEENRGNQ